MSLAAPHTLPMFAYADLASPVREERRAGASPPPLVVDHATHAAEIARFWSKVVQGPGEHCWLWTAAISDDGYGTYSIIRDGRRRTVRAHRYAAAAQLGIPVPYGAVVEHVICDAPLCVRAHPDPAEGHLWPSTQRENLLRMWQKKRHRRWWIRRWANLARHERAQRSRALAAAVADGWDESSVRAVLLTIDPAQIALFP